jgi:2-oxoisovalerate dehydrogenase E1 component
MVMRVPVGGYLKGGAVYHSQSGTTLFSHTPGLMIVYPSTALDANGLLRTAIRCDDPVLFLEHKTSLSPDLQQVAVSVEGFSDPVRQGEESSRGNDVTIITYGALVERSNQAAKRLEQQVISVELIDLRTLVPYDWEAIAESVKKTSRVIVAHEDPISWGYGAEIAARIRTNCSNISTLRPPSRCDRYIRRVRSAGEDFILPQSEDVEAAVNELMKY